jgi:hypothetical protein
VSAGQIFDTIQFRLLNNETLITKNNNLPVIYNNQTRNLSRQLSGYRSETVILEVVNVAAQVMNTGSGTTIILSMFFKLALDRVLGRMQTLNIICVCACLEFLFPAALLDFN